MQKSRKVWSKGLSFFMVLVLAFTSVFFNITPINAGVKPDQVNSGVHIGMTLVDITGGDYINEPANNDLELIKGEEYTLKLKLAYQNEGGFEGKTGGWTDIEEGNVKLYLNNSPTEFAAFPAFSIRSRLFTKPVYTDLNFKAGESNINENGMFKDYIVARGETQHLKSEIILSSYLIYNLKLKVDFYYEGDKVHCNRRLVSWNDTVKEPDHKLPENGYEFSGWYYKNNPKREFNFDAPITDNVELVAKYEKVENNNKQQKEENKKTVTVTFNLDGKSESVTINKDEKFSDARNDQSIRFNGLKQEIEKGVFPETLLNGKFDAMEYDWYKESTFKNLADDNEKIDVDKTYYVQVNGLLNNQAIEAFQQGVRFLDGKVCKPAQLIIHSATPVLSTASVTISEGKFHQVKKMFLAIGVKVIYLKRTHFGDFQLDPSLAEGDYRSLNQDELKLIKNYLELSR